MNLVLNLILAVQHGKGADMGAAFGSGTSGSLFGASGSANFLSRTTAVLASVFFACTLLLAYFGTPRPSGMGSVLDSAPAVTTPAPAGAPGAAQIPSGGTPPADTTPAPTAPAPSAPAAGTPSGASGAAQIPTK